MEKEIDLEKKIEIVNELYDKIYNELRENEAIIYEVIRHGRTIYKKFMRENADKMDDEGYAEDGFDLFSHAEEIACDIGINAAYLCRIIETIQDNIEANLILIEEGYDNIGLDGKMSLV